MSQPLITTSETTLGGFPWATLLKKISVGLCTPFIGAGASYPRIPLGKHLAAKLLERFGEPCPLPDKNDFARVCQFLSIKRRDPFTTKFEIAEIIDECLAPDFSDSNEIYRILAEIPFALYTTTNYDNFMYLALEYVRRSTSSKRNPLLSVKRDFCRWTEKLLKENPSVFDDRRYEPDQFNPLVFHLHGHVDEKGYSRRRGPIEAMVATEDDYLDFLVNITEYLRLSDTFRVSKRQMLPLPICAALRGTTLLFIGYSLGDVNFRVILRALRRSLQTCNEPLHVAIQYGGDDPRELRDYFAEYFRRLLKLDVFWCSTQDFMQELRARWMA